MPVFACTCGKTYRSSDEARRSIRCPACGERISADAPPPAESDTGPIEKDVSAEAPPRPRPVAPSAPRSMPPTPRPAVPVAAPAAPRAVKTWSRRYAFLALAVLPLLMPLGASGVSSEEEFIARVEKTLEDSKATEAERQRVYRAFKENPTVSGIVEALPGHKLEGALLPKKTWSHWLFALFSAGGYFAFLLLVFPPGLTNPKHLVLTGVFTATIGILLLLLVQLIASSGIWIRGGGQLAILFLILKFIGFSYNAALDPENGFIVSFLGFTAGVGFCEELCKQLPLIYHFREKASLDWRGACLWGLASGVGFGVSEGITYSSDFYNGVSGAPIYVVRFVACVGLHAIWAASAGIMLQKRQQSIQGQMAFLAYIPPMIAILAAPMVLHGLYDTLLKKDHEFFAFLTAVASFGWLAYQVEMAVKEDKAVGVVV